MDVNWKDEFIALYMSNNHEDFKKSLEVRKQNIPHTLYRYRPVGTGVDFARLIESMRVGTLFCSYRDNLNDPFELRSPLSSKKSSDYLGSSKSTNSMYFDQLKKHFDETELSETLQDDDWFEKLQQLIFREEAERSGHSIEYIQSVMNDILMEQVEDLSSAYESIFNMNRVASFTENCCNLPMWQHYADAHKGVCVAYDMTELRDFDINHFFPIMYVKELPDAIRFATQKLSMKEKPPFGFVAFHCIHKLLDWSYEKEWRYLYQPGLRYYSHEDIPAEYWGKGVKVDFPSPAKIILGNKIEQDIKLELCRIAEELCISVTQMKITPYGLEEVPNGIL